MSAARLFTFEAPLGHETVPRHTLVHLSAHAALYRLGLACLEMASKEGWVNWVGELGICRSGAAIGNATYNACRAGPIGGDSHWICMPALFGPPKGWR